MAKQKKDLYRVTVETAGGFVTKYDNSLKRLKSRNFAGVNNFNDLIKRGYSGTISRLNKKTNRFKKVKKIGW